MFWVVFARAFAEDYIRHLGHTYLKMLIVYLVIIKLGRSFDL